MRIVYYALKPVQVGDGIRDAGDLIPEACEWPFVDAYVRDGKIAPLLVATLPRKAQEELERWEEQQRALRMAVLETKITQEGSPVAPVTTKEAVTSA